MGEGYIKFECEWIKKEIQIPEDTLISLGRSRKQLYQLELVGMYPDGIGFGNISVRSIHDTFYITGSATGQFSSLTTEHYAEVLLCNFAQNKLTCIGQTKASAESLTHAAIYEALPEVKTVVHIHSLNIWEKLLNIYPTTAPEIEYGTPEMAEAVFSTAKKMLQSEAKIIIMGGHKEGILSYGNTLDEATNQILKIYKSLSK
jgi:Ribulose-5-phosphate 4-epimerase and related epimerases and aldolases